MPLYAFCAFVVKTRRLLLIFLFFGATLGVYALDDFPVARGDSAMAERYAQWAKDAVDKGRWSEALAALERAQDFADVSSDISYLFALALSREGKDRGLILEALNQALYVDRWKLYDRESARLLKADNLISVRAYNEALDELYMVRKSPREAELALRILAASQPGDFLSYLTHTLDLYPRECGPVRIFFDFLKAENKANRSPGRDELELLELVIRRIPVLLLKCPELAWMAGPFMRDSAEAKRLVSAYRAVNDPVAASLPAALRLGVIDEETALEELFTGKILDRALLDEVWELLRRQEAKLLFGRNLSAFTGVITEDADGDGIPEIFAEYIGGMLLQYRYDADQDGIPDLTVFFEAGNPRRALTLIPPESAVRNRAPPRKLVELQWERYPAVLEMELEGVRFVPRPLEFHFSPLKFVDHWNSGLLYPEWDPLVSPLTRRVIVSNAFRVERPSLEFSGGTEVVELAQGIPVRAREYVGNLKVSETEFLRGRPQLQRLDLDFDGRVDTVRRFSKAYRQVELEELWDYDRDIEFTVTVTELEVEW